MAQNILVRIVEEYGYQDWWAVYTPEQFENIKRRWQTMKGLNCLVPVDIVFPGARGCYGEWPPKALCPAEAEKCKVVNAHVHQYDDSYLEGVTYEIPPPANEEDDSFEIDGVQYSANTVHKLLADSRKRRDDEFFTTYPEHAAQAARAESETGE